MGSSKATTPGTHYETDSTIDRWTGQARFRLFFENLVIFVERRDQVVRLLPSSDPTSAIAPMPQKKVAPAHNHILFINCIFFMLNILLF